MINGPPQVSRLTVDRREKNRVRAKHLPDSEAKMETGYIITARRMISEQVWRSEMARI